MAENNKQNIKNISEISIKEPVLIKNITAEKKGFKKVLNTIKDYISFFGGILGLITVGYVINDRWFNESEIQSKIVSYASTYGYYDIMKINKPSSPPERKHGIKYFLKLSLNVRNKDLNFSNVEVLVKFKKIDTIFKGEIHSPRNYSNWIFFDSVNYKLNLPQEKLLYYKSVLNQNTTHLEYINFIVFDHDDIIIKNLNAEDMIPEYIQLVFESNETSIFRNKNKRLKTNKMSSNVSVEKLLWEDEIWIKLD